MRWLCGRHRSRGACCARVGCCVCLHCRAVTCGSHPLLLFFPCGPFTRPRAQHMRFNIVRRLCLLPAVCCCLRMLRDQLCCSSGRACVCVCVSLADLETATGAVVQCTVFLLRNVCGVCMYVSTAVLCAWPSLLCVPSLQLVLSCSC